MDSASIIAAVTGVTKRWTKQRKAEERDASRTVRRGEAMIRSCRVTLKDASFDAIPEAYRKASSDGRLPAHARQIMYAARGAIQERTGERLDDRYFTQSLLPEYLRVYRAKTADWDVVFDARGHFCEPHTGRVVPLGTLEVRAHLHSQRSAQQSESRVVTRTLFPTRGPEHRYGAVLFIEKEGFLPIFERAQLAKRYDVAIMSTKGISVVAARQLVDELCGKHQIPLLVLHDLDKAGFSILGTLRRDTARYKFRNKFDVVDLGLRLSDVEEHGLDAEDFYLKAKRTSVRSNLLRNGATAEEADFICNGQRVELNAFGSAELIAWIESKLAAHGIRKVVPDTAALEQAYRRAVHDEYVSRRVADLNREAAQFAAEATIPKSLTAKVRTALTQAPADAWDIAVRRTAGRYVARTLERNKSKNDDNKQQGEVNDNI